MNVNQLISATEYMWGDSAEVFNTKVKGIYDTRTARHGGYLVDINIHPEFKNYGAETNDSSIRAFEEDYEAMKILWVYPELLQNPEKAKEWLTKENVIRYEANDNFLKDFPERNIMQNQEKEEEEIL